MNIKDHEAAIRKKLDALRQGIAYDRYEATFKGEDQVQGEHITMTVPCCPDMLRHGTKYTKEEYNFGGKTLVRVIEKEFEHRALPYKDVRHIKGIFEKHFGHVFRAIKHNGIQCGNNGTYFLLTLQLEDEKIRGKN